MSNGLHGIRETNILQNPEMRKPRPSSKCASLSRQDSDKATKERREPDPTHRRGGVLARRNMTGKRAGVVKQSGWTSLEGGKNLGETRKPAIKNHLQSPRRSGREKNNCWADPKE